MYRHRILDEVIVHAPDISRCVRMMYACEPWLVSGGRLIQSLQDTRKGDPLGIYLFTRARSLSLTSCGKIAKLTLTSGAQKMAPLFYVSL